ncbi:Epsin-1, required for endocytosis and actin patch assembly [Phytophthora pseudosyringae]|uniref:Epsin-1, required for endocytosis and actin patch assembly n=1 Tax=Phytophthora pseudosyringae TaxID=221518 RepID=A0A8T1VRB3_9STRA|nr:Epsin-1, required for endocytosis and actin patch assembly [Phytophthora pseudosyringae]
MAMIIAIIATAVMLTEVTKAGYVDLFRDADFKDTLARVDDVVLDACYSFTCPNLDNAITSAKWHGLPETGILFEGGDAFILFNTGKNCDGKDHRWPINTQSRKGKHFPENFRLDGINDDISSFKVLNKGGDAGMMYICSLPESGEAINATASEGSSSSANNTMHYM